jgi:hypothetical protein
LQDVQLCQTDTAICALSNNEGQVSIELPIGVETSVTLKKDGYASNLVPVVIPSQQGLQETFTMGTDREMVAQFGRLGFKYPMLGGTGAVAVWVFPSIAGATFELVNATGNAYYVHESWEWRPPPDLTATTYRGGGGFVEVPPGDAFLVNLGGTAAGCGDATWGWLGEDPDSFRFPVREGYITVVSVRCPLPSTVQLKMIVVEPVEGLGHILDGPRLEGAEVCEETEETDTINCATTDVNGEARLLVQRDEEISYTATKEDYVPFLNGVVTDRSKLQPTFMLRDAQMEALAEDLGIDYPLTGGIVALRAFPRAMGGVMFAVDDETAVGYYVDEALAVRLDLTATTSRGGGGFLEVTPGVREIDFGGTATTCIPGRAWQGNAENQIRVPVEVGHITYAQMFSCDEP